MALSNLFLVLNIIVIVIANETVIEHEREDYVHIIHFAGYEAQAHKLITEDGYMLEILRIPYKRHQNSSAADRPVVLLMHGLLKDASAFIALGPQYTIAYNLADAGFDVWLGNARGTRRSRQHTKLNPNKLEDRLQFFNFTWEQIGYYDLATTVDYITLHTGVEKIHFIGHGQGATVFLVLNSMRPEYNNKFKSAHLLAPIGYQKHFSNHVLRSLARFSNTIFSLTQRLKIVELFPPPSKISRTGNETSDENITNTYDCDNVQVCSAVLCTGNPYQKEICGLLGIEEIMSSTVNEPGGAATKQIVHFGQNIQDRAFRRWNYGPEANFEIYGVNEPPIYDLSLISVPITLHYTVSDNVVDEKDIKAMADDLQNAKVRKVGRDNFQHVDFVVAADVNELVTVYMIEEMFRLEEHIAADDSEPERQPEHLDSSVKLPGLHAQIPTKKRNISSFPISLDFHLKVYLILNISYHFLNARTK